MVGQKGVIGHIDVAHPNVYVFVNALWTEEDPLKES